MTVSIVTLYSVPYYKITKLYGTQDSIYQKCVGSYILFYYYIISYDIGYMPTPQKSTSPLYAQQFSSKTDRIVGPFLKN